MAGVFTLNSKLKEIFSHPIGHDVLHKILLQTGVGDGLLNNAVVGNLTLGQLQFLTKKTIGANFYQTLINLLNSEKSTPKHFSGKPQEKWWKEAVFYQIYPRSFMDANGDGIGDLKGILSKLDYLQSLGIDALWLSPIYDSPGDDNGYDIRDYYKIAAEYGSMEDFDALLSGIHERNMRLIMDLVVNHTSDEHQWFQSALQDPESPYKNYYHFAPSSTDEPPNNWTSFFSGSAWNYYETQDEWALHLFSKKQMDLNWDNISVRRDVYKMIRWWLEKGVDGFRMDVINYISKAPGLPMGDSFIGGLMEYTGIEHYFYGPKLHTYLAEMQEKAFAPYDAFTVGETPGVGMEMSKLLTSESRKELDMVFCFDMLEMPGHVRFDSYIYDLNYMKKYLIDWMENYGDDCWTSLFYDNHDNPRMLSKIDPSGKYRNVLGKLLAVMQLTLKGTPFIFQGQELGAVNASFSSIQELRDVESINLYHELLEKMSPEEAFAKILSGTRDHARIPMQWSHTESAGFTTGEPWIKCVQNGFDAQQQQKTNGSIWNFYRRLIALRKKSKTLQYGKIYITNKKQKDIFTYYRKLDNELYYIEMNLCAHKKRHPICGTADGRFKKERLIVSNYGEPANELRPYEANIYICK